MANKPPRDWKELAQLAAAEQDPNRLLETSTNSTLSCWRERARPRPPGDRAFFWSTTRSIRLTLAPVLQDRGFEIQVMITVGEELSRRFEPAGSTVLICDRTSMRRGMDLKW